MFHVSQNQLLDPTSLKKTESHIPLFSHVAPFSHHGFAMFYPHPRHREPSKRSWRCGRRRWRRHPPRHCRCRWQRLGPATGRCTARPGVLEGQPVPQKTAQGMCKGVTSKKWSNMWFNMVLILLRKMRIDGLIFIGSAYLFQSITKVTMGFGCLWMSWGV